jgi:hypothetical protein
MMNPTPGSDATDEITYTAPEVRATSKVGRPHRRLIALIAAATMGGLMLGLAPAAQADRVAYLVNVTVRPGYNFPNSAAALDYGYGICDKIGNGERYPQLMGDVKNDFNTSDEFQASYLISQAANELCPAQIWQLRNSAAHYRPPAG